MGQIPPRIPTPFTDLFGCSYPLIAGPMFLVSNTALVIAVSESGAVGGMPSLNWKTTESFRDAVREVKAGTSKPFAVNLIVNKSAPRVEADLAVCVEERVPLVITSLGNPQKVIEQMHGVGCKVFCDVTTLKYARKIEEQGADGVIAVSTGAGGHAGEISPLVLVPYLKKHLKIPIVAAGGVAHGSQIAALRLLGASAVQVGTRFIASQETEVGADYKEAIVKAQPEDIVLTKKLSGVPAAVIRTPYVDKIGLELNFLEKWLHKGKHTKKFIKMARFYIGQLQLERAIAAPTWKQMWGAGQGVGLIDSVKPAREIVIGLMEEYHEARSRYCGEA